HPLECCNLMWARVNQIAPQLHNGISSVVNTANDHIKNDEPEDDDEVVKASQELCTPSNSEFAYDKKERSDLDSKMELILSLYEQHSGERCRLPEKTKCPLRDEYRKLFCVGTVCEKLGNLLSSRLDTSRRLRNQRLDSLSQVKALCLRLEDLVASESTTEK
ncbi:hypothetical protein GCK32_016807, partial [Trichostrongylus colubriformis]